MKKCIPVLVLIFIVFITIFSGCPHPATVLDSAKSITAFSFKGFASEGTITGTNIAVTLPPGTAVTNLVAIYTTDGIDVSLNGTVQTSGTSRNDFTNPVVYRVTAEDGTFQDYTVTVQVMVRLIYDAGSENTSGTVPAYSDYVPEGLVTVSDNTGFLTGIVIRDDIKQRWIGWNTDSNAVTVEFEPGDTFTINADTTLYAIYTSDSEVLGKIGPAGGLVFYDAGSIEFWGRYVEAWIYDEGTYQWKETCTVSASTDNYVGIGHHNTYNKLTGEIHSAAEATRNASHNSKNDWFLPAKDELGLMYTNLKVHGLGNFSDDKYWCCNGGQTKALADCQDFSDGTQVHDIKTNFLYVRAVRYFN